MIPQTRPRRSKSGRRGPRQVRAFFVSVRARPPPQIRMHALHDFLRAPHPNPRAPASLNQTTQTPRSNPKGFSNDQVFLRRRRFRSVRAGRRRCFDPSFADRRLIPPATHQARSNEQARTLPRSALLLCAASLALIAQVSSTNDEIISSTTHPRNRAAASSSHRNANTSPRGKIK